MVKVNKQKKQLENPKKNIKSISVITQVCQLLTYCFSAPNWPSVPHLMILKYDPADYISPLQAGLIFCSASSRFCRDSVKMDKEEGLFPVASDFSILQQPC